MQLYAVKYRQSKPLPPHLWFHNLITLLGMQQSSAQPGPRPQPTPCADEPCKAAPGIKLLLSQGVPKD